MQVEMKREIQVFSKGSPYKVQVSLCAELGSRKYLWDIQDFKKLLESIFIPLSFQDAFQQGFSLFEQLEKDIPSHLTLTSIKLLPCPEKSFCFFLKKKFFFKKTYQLRAAHTLKICGDSKKMAQNLHGHTYGLTWKLQAKPEEQKDLFIQLDELVYEKILLPYQGKILNDFFENTSAEGLVQAFFEIMKKSKIKKHLICLHLQETQANYFTYPV